MEFEWDEAKRASNLEKHGVDFAEVPELFAQFHHRYPSPRGPELRWVAIGTVKNRILAVVFTVRDTRYRLISARRARRAEEITYRAFLR